MNGLSRIMLILDYFKHYKNDDKGNYNSNRVNQYRNNKVYQHIQIKRRDFYL